MPPVHQQDREYLQDTEVTVNLVYIQQGEVLIWWRQLGHSSLSCSPSTLTRTNTAFSPAELDRCSEYFPESSLVLSGMTRKDMVSTWST